ncbi:2643_t:CDS:2 [Racocetra fulgida]|uniref:2643_t:CDS:1 n=1 Tax=Racocetra fulgida TaxID=60492 RepID=A0A9N9INN3_9GLOM|nr:2643_t:CDS:2 [Racocetra fulgida]
MNQKLQEENKIAKYQNERLTKKQEQIFEEIRSEIEQYNEKEKIFNVLDEKIDIVLANFNFEVLFPLDDTLEKMEKIVELCNNVTQINQNYSGELNRIQQILNDLKQEETTLKNKISQCKDKNKDYEQNKEVNQELKNLEYDYKSLERTLNSKLEQLEKEKEINIEVLKRIEILNQKADIVLKNFKIQSNHPTLKNKLALIKKIKIQELINKLREEIKNLSKEKDNCEKENLDNQQIINENKHLKEQNFENKIQEKIEEISVTNRVLDVFIKNNNLERDKELINDSLKNFKIAFNETDSLEHKMDLIIEFSSKNIQS